LFTHFASGETLSTMTDPCPLYITQWWEWHPPVGAFIAILAVLGVLVPLFREWGKIRKLEKALWTVLMFALVGLELRTLYLDRDEHDREQAHERCTQKQSFEAIASGLETSIRNSEGQYASTVSHVDDVLKTTQAVAGLAKTDLANITGGDAFAYVYPSRPEEGNDLVTLNVHNDGAQVLSGVVVTIRRVISGSPEPEVGDNSIEFEGKPAINIGSLAPHEGRLVPGETFRPITGVDGTGIYHVWVNAQNPGTSENLYFRRSKNGLGWSYMLKAWKVATGKKKKGDVFVASSNVWIRYVKTVDWVEPTKQR
jgi:hypothetical protein